MIFVARRASAAARRHAAVAASGLGGRGSALSRPAHRLRARLRRPAPSPLRRCFGLRVAAWAAADALRLLLRNAVGEELGGTVPSAQPRVCPPPIRSAEGALAAGSSSLAGLTSAVWIVVRRSCGVAGGRAVEHGKALHGGLIAGLGGQRLVQRVAGIGRALQLLDRSIAWAT